MVNSNKAIIFAAILLIGLLVLPLPTALLDVLMAVNLISAILVLLVTICAKKTKNFTLLPTLLLVLSLFNLSIHISFTRIILTKGAAFDGQLVLLIASFMSDPERIINLIIGAAIFLLFLSFLVITVVKWTVRILEVAARFALNNLPSKQMAIDAEYSSGFITKEELMTKKAELQGEMDFFGSMDGASKFMSGNVKVNIFITLVNITGGIIIGTRFHGEELITAVTIYVPLAMAAGFLAQLPVLFESIAVRIIITRLIPDISSLGIWGCKIFKRHNQSGPTADTSEKNISSDILSLELGFGLIPLVDKDKGAELLEGILVMRSRIARDIGLTIPKIRIIDNMLLGMSEYCIKIRGEEKGRGDLGSAADPVSAITDHFAEIIKKHAAEIMDGEQKQALNKNPNGSFH